MADPLSIAAIGAATEIAKNEVIEKTIEEVAEAGIDEINETKLRFLETEGNLTDAKEHVNNEFYESCLAPTETDQKIFKAMMRDIRLANEVPDTRRSVYNKLMTESKRKGDMGEYLAGKNLARLGDFRHGIVQGENVLDWGTERLNKNASFKEILTINEELIEDRLYIPKGRPLAVEVKNGGLAYLKSEVNNGHLMDQIKAGKEAFQTSLVGIRHDIFKEIIENPEKSIDLVNKINEAGGRLVSMLPDVEIQQSIYGGMMS